MSLSSVLNNAKSSIAASAAQTALVSRNIANVNDPAATKKYAKLGSVPGAGLNVLSIARSGDAALFRNFLETSSALGSSQVLAEALNRIRETIGDVDEEGSPAASIGALKDALASFAVSPANREFARAAVDAARDVANGLNAATRTVQGLRKDADDQLVIAAKTMNELLGTLETVNAKMVRGTQTGADVTDFIDQRDGIVAELSQYVGVSTKIRANNELVVYTDSGLTLFEGRARLVEFTGLSAYDATVSGGDFKIDGMPVYGERSSMPIKSGSVLGLLELRDETTVTYQNQLDEIARGLVEAFAETDRTGVDPKSYAGLFTFAATGPTEVLPSGTIVQGLAGTIRIAATVDPMAGGNPFLLRDGGISHVGEPEYPDFVYNTAGSVGFTARISALADSLDRPRAFDASAKVGSSARLVDFAAASIGWLEGQRADATAEAEYKATLLARTRETLSDKTGINLEEEMTHLLDLERSYQASAKLITTVGEMLDALLQSIR